MKAEMRRLAAAVLASALALMPAPARAGDLWGPALQAAAISAIVTAVVFIGAVEGQATMEEFAKRSSGDPALPYLRLDQGYQLVGTAAQGSSTRLQAGYAMLGAGFEFLHYWQRRPASQLDYWQAEALLRMTDRPSFRADLSYGYREESAGPGGAKPQAGFSLGAYGDWGLGLESDLRWARSQGRTVFGDGRVRAVFRLNRGHLSLFGGYRFLRVAGGKRDGPDAGLTLTW